MAFYEIITLGSPTGGQLAELNARVAEAASAFSLIIPDDVVVRDGSSVSSRNPKAATVALYFGGDPAVDVDKVNLLEAAKVPVVPVVVEGASITKTVPAAILPVNACIIPANDVRLEALAAVALEVVGLLHRQRRVFVSYRRTDSREVAVQLHDELSGRGFDVFLDTHDIRLGADFQEMLWHRLVDCDVMIMLDTKDYFTSKWTKQELGRSLALGVQILRIVWPDHSGSRHLSLSDTIKLADADIDAHQRLAASSVSEVARRAEALRSRSIATRQLEIAGKLRIEVERIGGRFEGIGAHRAIGLTLPHGKSVEAYPIVGVPTAELLNDVHSKATTAGHGRFPCLVYDHTGIRPAWLNHLAWLDENIAGVRTLKVFGAGWELAEWDS
ncbi:toll/interleukin-1 receptor domain-containing protein [Aurantimonas sp. C2-6-R+9]|uniref:toll/interleukin-1 receptor domain-containing protein n=2 Tax=Aurantimonas TaxID=182269 RepID=UPI002E1772B3|nr:MULTISPECIES: toll/interleukin-1 receptor domain-containing protein [unclassified Aurantimonas]MEC5383655.1 toll/interleukin-1 receptor domain-containing protein [Aurantimonas sp. C2-6-R+9]MEC5414663.1 toll/interleukin-1 receptor domain-containing protein [Aurantimonas sp. C2-4-R8]